MTFEGEELVAALLEDEGDLIEHSKSQAFIVKEYEFQVADKSMNSAPMAPGAVKLCRLLKHYNFKGSQT